jgi:hypothetical protein
MARLYVNNFSTVLGESISNSDTTFDLVDASGLGSPSGGDFVTCTIDDNAGNREIIYVTGVSSNTITCTRGEEGTSGQAFASGISIEARLTKAGLDEKQEALNGLAIPSATVASSDKVLFLDTTDSDNLKQCDAEDIAALAPAAGVTLWDTRTASSSTSLDFTDLPDSASIMFILCDILPATDNANLQIRTSNGTGGSPTFDTGGTDYGYGLHGLSTASHVASATASASSILTMATLGGTGISNVAGETCNGTIYLYNPLGSGYTVLRGTLGYINQDALPAVYDFTGARKSGAAVNAVRFFMSTGNIASGKIYAYIISKT